jgi:hypothetical protein
MTPEQAAARERVEQMKEGYRAAHRFVHKRLVALGYALPLTWVDEQQAARLVVEAMIAYVTAYGISVTADVIDAALFHTPQEVGPE